MQPKSGVLSGAALLLPFLFAATDLCSKHRAWRHLEKFQFHVAKTTDLSIKEARAGNEVVERIKTKTKASPTLPMAAPATTADFRQAIAALTREDTERIRQSAQNRMYWIGPRAANRRDAGDLINEAFERVLDGTRHWYKERVAFTPFLVGVVWSIASEWAGYRERNKKSPEFAELESQLTRTDEEGKQSSPFDGLPATSLSPEQALIEAEAISEREKHSEVFMERIKAEFADDISASLVIDGILDGLDGPAIRAILELSDKEYKATMRRIQRHVRKLMEQSNAT
jgi:DNA-directed RNA polymerase specialized sigma24 family protein